MSSLNTLLSLFLLLTTSLLSFSFSSSSPSSQSLSLHNKANLSPFILPIEKDPLTKLFYTSLGIGTPEHKFNLVIDLGGPTLWYDCNNNYNSSTYHPLPCESKLCSGIGGCTACNGHFKPGCTNNTCGANIINPLADSIFSGDTGEDVLFITNSKQQQLFGLLSDCTNSDGFSDDSPLKGLPKSSKGILGLARTQLSLPTQISSSFHNIPQKFAFCLPSSNKKGFGSLFIGGAPHQNSLKFTPLIVNPFSTAPIFNEGDVSYEYFIDVKSIKVGGKVVDFKSSLLSIDNKGNGGTKISTMNSFTVLHSSIYKPVVRDFIKVAYDRKMKKVESVEPFGTCFEVRSSISDLDVPCIDLVLEGGVVWTIYGENSLVLVKENVACLGFLDGGRETRTSFVIGGHQLEDNLLDFDLVSSKLGFSSSLLLHDATCSNITTYFLSHSPL